MSEYFKYDGSDMIGTEVTATNLWDEVDLASKNNITMFTDSSVSSTLNLHTPDPDGTYHNVNSFSLDSGGDMVILSGNYTAIKFSVDTDNTMTAWFEES